jgi:pyruvate kinase
MMQRRTKIIATIGPATASPEKLGALIEAGLDMARFNFSHGDQEQHSKTIRLLREIAQKQESPVGVLQDLQGPRLRTGELEGQSPIRLEVGSAFALCTDPVLGNVQQVFVSYPRLSQDLKPGDTVLIDNGRIELRVTETTGDRVHTQVVGSGELRADKGLNFPGVTLSAPAFTEKDRRDLALGLELGVDAVAMSFVRGVEDLQELKQIIGDVPLSVIAKLERAEAIDALEQILAVADGVMVARGDLGVEMPAEQVPSIQKRIIQRANESHTIVITATEMLDSMIRNPRPTRAEASDVANAVFDGSDALMLSGETAIGEYPVQSLETMSRIILDAEANAHEWGNPPEPARPDLRDDAVATTRAARKLAEDRQVAAVAVFTRTGRTARLMSKARPTAPIIGFTPEITTYAQMTLLWGVDPKLCPLVRSVEEMMDIVESELRGAERVEPGEQVVVVASLPLGERGPPNSIYLRTVS